MSDKTNSKEQPPVDNTQVIETNTVEVIDTREIAARTENEVRQKESTRIREIMSIATRFKLVDAGQKAVNDGTTIDAFRQAVMDKWESSKNIDTGEANLDMPEKDIKRYSLGKIIQSAILAKPQIAEYEREVSEEFAKKIGREASGMWIPHEVLLPKALETMPIATREILTTTDGAGLLGTEHMPQNFIELLRNNMVVSSLGPLILTGLIENVQIPKQTGAATAEWEDPESTAVTPVNSVYGTVTLAPKITKASTEYSNKTLKQSLPSIEALVINDLTQVIAISIDLAAWAGAGATGIPEGIINTTGVGNITGTSLAWGHVVDAETTVMTANALAANNAYVTNPAVMGIMKQREKATGTAEFLWGADNSVNGYPGVVSTQIPAATLIFGSFNQLIMGFWGALDLIINPFSLDTQMATRITGAQAVDVAVRHPESFVVVDTIT